MKNIFGQQEDREQKDTQDFVREYQELCKKYKRIIMPQIDIQVAKMPEQGIIQEQQTKK